MIQNLEEFNYIDENCYPRDKLFNCESLLYVCYFDITLKLGITEAMHQVNH